VSSAPRSCSSLLPSCRAACEAAEGCGLIEINGCIDWHDDEGNFQGKAMAEEAILDAVGADSHHDCCP